MLKIKRLIAMMVLALAAGLYTPQAMAGDMLTPPIPGELGTPGLYGEIPNPPGITGEIGSPGLYGDMATGIYAAIVTLFG